MKRTKRWLPVCLVLCLFIGLVMTPQNAQAASKVLTLTGKNVKDGVLEVPAGSYTSIILTKSTAGAKVVLRDVKITGELRVYGDETAEATDLTLSGNTTIRKVVAKANMAVESYGDLKRITTVSVRDEVSVVLNTRVTNVSITQNVKNAVVEVNKRSGVILNKGSECQIKVNADTQWIRNYGDNSSYVLDDDVLATKVSLKGSDIVVEGEGKAVQVNVFSQNTQVKTEVNLVKTAASATGTQVGGMEIPASSTAKVTVKEEEGKTQTDFSILNRETNETTTGTQTVTKMEDGKEQTTISTKTVNQDGKTIQSVEKTIAEDGTTTEVKTDQDGKKIEVVTDKDGNEVKNEVVKEEPPKEEKPDTTNPSTSSSTTPIIPDYPVTEPTQSEINNQKLEKLNSQLAAGGNIICTETITIEPKKTLNIVSGATLSFAGEGKIVVEAGGTIVINGTLITTSSNQLVFNGKANSYPVGLFYGTWEKEGTTYQYAGTEPIEDSGNRYYKDEAGNEFWGVNVPLSITTEKGIDLNADVSFSKGYFFAYVLINGIRYDYISATNKWVQTESATEEEKALIKFEQDLGDPAKPEVVCSESIKIISGASITIPENKTLKFEGNGQITIEKGGNLFVYGTLVTEGNDINPLSEGIISLQNSSTWQKDKITYRSTGWGNKFYKQSGIDTWYLGAALEITTADEIIDLNKLYSTGNPGSYILLNGVRYDYNSTLRKWISSNDVASLTPFEKLVVKLENSKETEIVCTDQITVSQGSIIIPKGKTLKFEGDGKLILEKQGIVHIYGTLITTNDNFSLSYEDSFSHLIVLYPSATWEKGNVCYYGISENSSSIFYNNSAKEYWNVSKIEITAKEKVDLNGTTPEYIGGNIVLNNVEYGYISSRREWKTTASMTSDEKFLMELGNSDKAEIVCKEEITIVSGGFITIPENKTVTFEGNGKFIVESGGQISISGRLVTEEKNLSFPEEAIGAVILNMSGAWQRGNVTYQNISENYLSSIFNKFSENELWTINTLEITAPKEVKIDLNGTNPTYRGQGEDTYIILNGEQYNYDLSSSTWKKVE